MKFIQKTSDFIFLFLALGWAFFNVYFLPFAVWTAGVVRPWFVLQELLPYKDFAWIRTPFDIFLLSLWYSLFGVGEASYQLFSFALIVINIILVWTLSRILLGKYALFSFVFYILFLFPFFINTEEGELLLGVFNVAILISFVKYLSSKSMRWLFLTGLIGGMLYITKQNSAIVPVILLTVLIFDFLRERRKVFSFVRRVLIFCFGIIIPIAVLSFYFFIRGGLFDYLYYSVYFLLGPYRNVQNLIRGDGLYLVAAFFALLVPFLLFSRKTKLELQHIFLLTALTVASLSYLLPSLLSYRAYPAFGIVSLVAGYNMMIFLRGENKERVVTIIAFVLFFALTMRFLRAYQEFIVSNPPNFSQRITDYGENEREIADWIIRNTKPTDRIASFSNEIIFFLAERLPANKYIEPFPYVLRPYDRSSKLFIENPPKIVVYDSSLPAIHKGLESWPFIDFVEKNYRKVRQYGDTIILYEYPKN